MKSSCSQHNLWTDWFTHWLINQ